jgi:predicted nucleotidyltransferase
MSTQTAKKTISSKPKKKIGETHVLYKTRSKGTLQSLQNPIVLKCKKTLKKYYGTRLKGVILYGSLARKQASPASDIDLLVLLAPPLDYFAELRQLVDVLYPVQLESDRLISAKPVLMSDFETGSVSLYRNAKREGVLVG